MRKRGEAPEESRGGEVADDSDVKKFLQATFQWDEWTVTMMRAVFLVAAGVKEGRFVVPVEILITSVADEPLIHVRITAVKDDATDQADATELLQSDESKWKSLEIYPDHDLH